ncbi:MAG: CCA tRNA nucleotidyltransferase [Clostridiales bacterium]|nr:CCA tRNA nucleotidyltransferase [Clostridiales bacterium]
MKIQVPEEVCQVLSRLHRSGYEAYLVGGCVRDSLRGTAPKDWDVTTSALPEQTLAAMSGLRVIETGLKHGTVTIIPDTLPIEVTTYRVDGAYTDHRRPDSVSFTRSLREDLKRRDFTINALAYCEESGVIDCFGGQEDLHCGVIRCVGDAAQRFEEDALRILRGLRFASELCFSIDPDTNAAIEQKRGLLQFIAAERICAELRRLLCGGDAAEVLERHSIILSAVLPEVDVLPQKAGLIKKAPADLSLRLACLFTDLTPDSAASVLSRLRFDRRTAATVTRLLRFQQAPAPVNRPQIKQRLLELGPEFSFLLFEYQRILAPPSTLPVLDTAESLLRDVLQSGECWCADMLAVRGDDLIRAGFPSGKALGSCLGELLQLVMDGTLPNEKYALLAWAKERLSSLK